MNETASRWNVIENHPVPTPDLVEIERRKQWLQFTAADESRLVELDSLAQKYAEEVIESLYDHFLGHPETAAFFQDRHQIERVKELQRSYFRRLTQGNYDEAYAADRVKIGATHQRIGLDIKWYLGAYSFYFRALTARVTPHFENLDDALGYWHSLKKLMFFDIGLVLDNYIAARERVILQQQEALRELSTPILQIRPGLLMLPIIGFIDAQRAHLLTHAVLNGIRERRARVVVIDITGVPIIDAPVANHLVETVEECRLMGASVIVTGISPEIAQTLVALGIDLSKMRTMSDLEGGIAAADRARDIWPASR